MLMSHHQNAGQNHNIKTAKNVAKFRHLGMAVTNENLKNTIFWDVALCRSCVNRRVGGTYRLHIQGRKIWK
jgi:hypothetical protein